MPYLTPAVLRASLLNAGGPGAKTAAELDDEALVRLIGEAEGKAEARLSAFTLPTPAAIDETLPGHALLMSLFTAYAGYGATLEFFGSMDMGERDPVWLRYIEARDFLKEVARGNATIPGLDPVGPDVAPGEAAIYQGVPDVHLAGAFGGPYGGYRDGYDLQGGPYSNDGSW